MFRRHSQHPVQQMFQRWKEDAPKNTSMVLYTLRVTGFLSLLRVRITARSTSAKAGRKLPFVIIKRSRLETLLNFAAVKCAGR
eukprot:scaffold18922_cov61-Skeletonema_dohrnii-CCMP3373.AAC.1